jgi:hypothetical protein
MLLRGIGHQPGTRVMAFEALFQITSFPSGYDTPRAVAYRLRPPEPCVAAVRCGKPDYDSRYSIPTRESGLEMHRSAAARMLNASAASLRVESGWSPCRMQRLMK